MNSLAIGRLFGTDGVRGKANQHPMTTEVAMQLGRAAAHVLKLNHNPSKIVIGKDTRLSCYMLEFALASGFCSMGANVYLVGPMPTPAVALLAEDMRCDAGVVISASHNPFHDNGIKFFSNNGFKLSDKVETQIEELVFSNELDNYRPVADKVGKVFRIEDARGRYINFLKRTFPRHLSLEGLKIVIDCANGATYKVAPTILQELGANVITIGNTPNGLNINNNCGATFPEHLAKIVKQENADIGFAFDGDGDRLIPIDEKGTILTGDHVLAIAAKYLKDQNILTKNTVVATVMSNLGLEKRLQALNINLIRTQVGDRYVCEEMRKGNYTLGGEQSGHLIFLDHHTTGDGILAALQLLAIVKSENKPLSDLAKPMIEFPQVLQNVTVSEKRPIQEFPTLTKLIREIEITLGNSGRILIRPSGTEPKIRVMIEGENTIKINEYATQISEEIRKQMV